MPCSHCRQAGHNKRTCPLLKAQPKEEPKYSPVSFITFALDDTKTECDSSIMDRYLSDSCWCPAPTEEGGEIPKPVIRKKLSFSENPKVEEIPRLGRRKVVKKVPQKKKCENFDHPISKRVLKMYIMAMTGEDERIYNTVQKWKKYC